MSNVTAGYGRSQNNICLLNYYQSNDTKFARLLTVFLNLNIELLKCAQLAVNLFYRLWQYFELLFLNQIFTD